MVYVRVLVNDLLSLPTDMPPARPPGSPPLPESATLVVPEAGMREGDLVIVKRQWGAFYGTDLDQQLRRRGVNTVVIGGIATNMGVESTARSAWELSYDVVIAEDVCSSMSADWHRFSVEHILPMISRVVAAEAIGFDID